MNGIDKITDRIQRDTAEEIRALQQQTEAQCAFIAADGAKTAQDIYWAVMKSGKEEADLRMERLKSAAEMEAKKEVLRTKQELISRAFAYAAEKLRLQPKSNLIPFLARLAASASLTGEEAIVLSPEDRDDFGAELCRRTNVLLSDAGKVGKVTLSAETRQTGGGLILVNGRVETNCTFGVLVEGMRDELTQQVVGILFD
jgi:V/A-type H+/Na+-transporting ATPase subunit E